MNSQGVTSLDCCHVQRLLESPKKLQKTTSSKLAANDSHNRNAGEASKVMLDTLKFTHRMMRCTYPRRLLTRHNTYCRNCYDIVDL